MSKTIQQLRAGLEADLANYAKQIEADRRAIEAEISDAEARGQTNLSQAADVRCEALFRSIEAAKAARARKARALSDAIRIEAEESETDRRLAGTHSTGAPLTNRGTAVLGIGRNERTYDKSSDPNGRQFLSDVALDFMYGGRDKSGASERLSRHMTEERVERPQYAERALTGAGTMAFSGLTVPQYLVDMVAPAVTNLRPVADIANRHTLPEQGMSMNVSRITSPSTAALQTAEFQAVSGTDMDDTLLTVPVQTAAGSQLLSRQAIDRGAGVEDTTVADLLRQVNTTLDSTILNQAVSGLVAAAQSVSYVSAAPTAAELWPYLYQAESKLEKSVLGVARVDYAVMRTERFNWLCAQVGSTFPWMGSAGSGVDAHNGGIQLTNDYNSPVRAVLSNGLRVVCDNNLPSNVNGGQDVILVLASQEVHVWEDPNAPVLIRAEQPSAGNLGVLLVAFSYFGFTCGRYTGNPAKVTGTGCLMPVGF